MNTKDLRNEKCRTCPDVVCKSQCITYIAKCTCGFEIDITYERLQNGYCPRCHRKYIP